MEFGQPTGFYNNVYPNYVQPINLPSPLHLGGYPEIVGEGNVTSIISPDGSSQYVFMPTANWWRPYAGTTNIGSYNPYLNHHGAWLIRSIYSPYIFHCNNLPSSDNNQTLSSIRRKNLCYRVPPPVLTHPYQIPYGQTNPRVSTSDCCFNAPMPEFTLKFHNDKCTSTSDIHYFFPTQYNYWSQRPKTCATVQVEAPHAEVHCTKGNYAPIHQCKCGPVNRGKHKCVCIKDSHTSSAMSVEESKSNMKCHKKGKDKPYKFKTTKSKSAYVQCGGQSFGRTSDKYVTTYAEQATDCSAKNGQETQTGCPGCIPLIKANSEDFISTAELWTAKTPLSKRAMISSDTSQEQCICSTNCSSITDTEIDY